MKNRRAFLQSTAFLSLIPFAGCTDTFPTTSQETPEMKQREWFMPEEGEPHERTWMSFGPSEKVWGKKLIGEVRKNIATVAQTIAKFEPVVVCVRPEEFKLIDTYFESSSNIEFFECHLDDIWIRDFGAVFVLDGKGNRAAVDFNFNGWGRKQTYHNDSKIAARMATHAHVELLGTDICIEGGGIEVDGEGTAIVTESCVINRNRNPDWSKKDCEEELLHMLGVEKVIWLPGIKGADITDGHTDFYARFASPGVVVAHLDLDESTTEFELTRRHLSILENETDAKGQLIEVVPIESPKTVRPNFENHEFCAGYINFYVCNDALLMPEFGDMQADGKAHEIFKELFPGREIVPLNIDGIAAGGGGIHCATQQEPSA